MPAGTNVASGVLVSPGGQQGIPGPNAISTDAGNQATFGSDNRIYVPDPTVKITSIRLRSFNAVGNPNFEVDQRAVNGSLTYPAGSSTQFQADRWQVTKNAATATMTGGTVLLAAPNVTPVPSTNFCITNSYLQLGSTSTNQASLAAGEYIIIQQFVEGHRLRELMGDATSLSILCSAIVSTYPFNFSLFIHDNTNAHSIVLPCSVTALGAFIYFTFPNLPLWPSNGVFSQYQGVLGYMIGVCIGCGTTFQAPSSGSWLTGNYFGTAANTNNFLAASGNSFQLRFLQHEPGAICTPFIDLPFNQNLDECLRYFDKTYQYATKPGTSGITAGQTAYLIAAGCNPYMWVPFKKTMAKIPTVVGYSNITGAVNCVRDGQVNADRGITAVSGPGDTGYSGFACTAQNTVVSTYSWYHTADSGW